MFLFKHIVEGMKKKKMGGKRFFFSFYKSLWGPGVL